MVWAVGIKAKIPFFVKPQNNQVINFDNLQNTGKFVKEQLGAGFGHRAVDAFEAVDRGLLAPSRRTTSRSSSDQWLGLGVGRGGVR